MKFRDSRSHVMMVRDTSFKSVCFHETKFEIGQQKITANGILRIPKIKWIDI